MDVATIDNEYQQLQHEAQTTVDSIAALAQKLQAAAQTEPNAKEWLLDLKQISLQIQQEQLQTQALLQAIHGFMANNLPQGPQTVTVAPVETPAVPPQRGGVLSHFMGSGFGQAMTTGVGMGAGFGLADSVLNSIFG